MATLPALLFLHGAGDSGACWEPFVDRLRRQPGLSELLTSTPDLPQHGSRGHVLPVLLDTSGGQERTITWPDLLADGTEFVRELAARSGGPIVIAGHSLGARVALGVAAVCPDLIAAVFLEDPPFGISLARDALGEVAPDFDPTGIAEWLKGLQRLSDEELLVCVRNDHPNWDEAELLPWVQAKRAVNASSFAGVGQWLRSGFSAEVAAIHCPVVMVVGDLTLGGITHPDAVRDLAELENWRVITLPVGHDVRRDSPQASADALAELLHTISN